ncbi:Asp-tRNA(Asn)/Glu-tRNA(Gln) amidotransferase subunit GatA [Ilyobacter sp.]|uniref:Asp-tRNA(Asn)/Glu-tRNA(Gln) amidotransferase subunit GatA n=1 Tax=Ilyobacter sp. TaxID=3100343 RepID=UPI0035618739
MDRFYKLTAFEIKEKVSKGEIKAVDVIADIFDRIEKTESKIDSFVSLRKEGALEDARRIDEKVANGEKLGALAGVPVALKDNMVSYDEPSSSCSKILEGYIGVYDATVVKKIKESDAIIIGKTNMDQFAMGSSTVTSCYKKTKNPWDLERVPGGSSGGSASAVAAQQAIITLGSDTGGSIRQPASFCGIVGLKPTYGRVSRYGLMAFASSLDQIGPFTKTVKDAALCMNVIAGSDDYDSTVQDVEVPDYTTFLTGDVKGMKIGVPKEYFVEGMKPEVEKAVRDAMEKFKEMGAEIVDISLPHTKYGVSAYYIIAPAEASSNLARFDGVRYGHRSEDYKGVEDLYFKSRSEGFGDEVKRRIMMGTYVLSAGFYDAYYKKAQKVRRLMKEEFDRAFENVDIILTPTAPSAAFRLDDEKTPLEMYLEDVFTIPLNMAGLPGISVPAEVVNGLPVGIQIVGKPFGEGDILRAADAFEKARGEWEFPEFE